LEKNVNLFDYMNANPINTFFIGLFLMITLCAVSSHVCDAIGILFSRINAGKDVVEVEKD